MHLFESDADKTKIIRFVPGLGVDQDEHQYC